MGISTKYKNIFNYWQYHGSNVETVDTIRLELREENVHLLRYMSVIVMSLTFFLSWFPLFVKHNPLEAGCYYLTTALSFVVFLLAGKMKKNPNLLKNTFQYKFMCILFAHLTLCFGIYVGVVSNSTMVAGLYCMILVWISMTFIISAVDNLIVALTSAIIFIVLCYNIKDNTLFLYDLADCIVAFIVSQTSSWIIGKRRIEKFVSGKKLRNINDHLYWSSTHDHLTGLFNRRKFFEDKKLYIDIDNKVKCNMLILIIDIDFFKDFNDMFGHDEGDLLLIEFANMLQIYYKDRDAMFCRWGGEEFMCVMPLKPEDEPYQLSDNFIKYVNSRELPTGNTSVSDHLSVSMGGTTINKGEIFIWNKIYNQCDNALYIAKNNGRNMVMMYSENI